MGSSIAYSSKPVLGVFESIWQSAEGSGRSGCTDVELSPLNVGDLKKKKKAKQTKKTKTKTLIPTNSALYLQTEAKAVLDQDGVQYSTAGHKVFQLCVPCGNEKSLTELKDRSWNNTSP